MKIGVVFNHDGCANSVRAFEIKKFLEKHGNTVGLIDVSQISGMNLIQFLKKPKLVMNKYFNFDILHMFQKKDELIKRELKKYNFDVVIFELFSSLLAENQDFIKIYSCATPFVDELKLIKYYSKEAILKLRILEKDIYDNADKVLFHWKSYEQFVRKNITNNNNFMTVSSGCTPKKIRSQFKASQRIAYLGNLAGYWVNHPLLSKLSRKIQIDVYGKPRPKKKYRLNYNGYSSPDILANYQFGLITCTKDPLRRGGFSAKHLEYISYGLPVLVPEWRKTDIKGSIFYNEHNFLEVIKNYSDESKWQKMSNIAYTYSKKFDWNITLKPLLELLKNY